MVDYLKCFTLCSRLRFKLLFIHIKQIVTEIMATFQSQIDEDL